MLHLHGLGETRARCGRNRSPDKPWDGPRARAGAHLTPLGSATAREHFTTFVTSKSELGFSAFLGSLEISSSGAAAAAPLLRSGALGHYERAHPLCRPGFGPGAPEQPQFPGFRGDGTACRGARSSGLPPAATLTCRRTGAPPRTPAGASSAAWSGCAAAPARPAASPCRRHRRPPTWGAPRRFTARS